MPIFGKYETCGDPLSQTGAGNKLFAARPAGSEEPARFAIETFEPPPILNTGSAVAAFRAQAQAQHYAALKSKRWAPVHDIGTVRGVEYYVTDLYSVTADQLSHRPRPLNARELHAIVKSVLEGLRDIHVICARGHGNLKLTRILLKATGRIETAQVLLSRPAPRESSVPSADLQALAGIIRELARTQDFRRFGQSAEPWRQFCERLTTTPIATAAELEELLRDVPAAQGRSLAVPVGGAVALLAVLAAAGVAWEGRLWDSAREKLAWYAAFSAKIQPTQQNESLHRLAAQATEVLKLDQSAAFRDLDSRREELLALENASFISIVPKTSLLILARDDVPRLQADIRGAFAAEVAKLRASAESNASDQQGDLPDLIRNAVTIENRPDNQLGVDAVEFLENYSDELSSLGTQITSQYQGEADWLLAFAGAVAQSGGGLPQAITGGGGYQRLLSSSQQYNQLTDRQSADAIGILKTVADDRDAFEKSAADCLLEQRNAISAARSEFIQLQWLKQAACLDGLLAQIEQASTDDPGKLFPVLAANAQAMQTLTQIDTNWSALGQQAGPLSATGDPTLAAYVNVLGTDLSNGVGQTGGVECLAEFNSSVAGAAGNPVLKDLLAFVSQDWSRVDRAALAGEGLLTPKHSDDFESWLSIARSDEVPAEADPRAIGEQKLVDLDAAFEARVKKYVAMKAELPPSASSLDDAITQSKSQLQSIRQEPWLKKYQSSIDAATAGVAAISIDVFPPPPAPPPPAPPVVVNPNPTPNPVKPPPVIVDRLTPVITALNIWHPADPVIANVWSRQLSLLIKKYHDQPDDLQRVGTAAEKWLRGLDAQLAGSFITPAGVDPGLSTKIQAAYDDQRTSAENLLGNWTGSVPDARIESAVAELSRWPGYAKDLSNYLRYIDESLDNGAMPDQIPAPQSNPLFSRLTGLEQVDRLAQVRRDRATMQSIQWPTASQISGITELAVAYPVWMRLQGNAAWPRDGADLLVDRALRQQILTLSTKADKTRNVLAGNLQAMGPRTLWRFLARAAGDADIKAADQLKAAFAVASLDDLAGDARVKFNLALWRSRGWVMDHRQDLKRGDLQTELDGLIALQPPQATVDRLRKLRQDLAAPPPTQAGPLKSILNPTLKSPESSDGQVTYDWNGHDLTFQRLRGTTKPAFLCTMDVDIGLVADVVAAVPRGDEWQTKWIQTPPDNNGPLAWQWVGGQLQPAKMWLNDRFTRIFGEAMLYVNNLAPAQPDRGYPMHHISPDAAQEIARILGCRLPTTEEWQAAYDMESARNKFQASDWFLRGSAVDSEEPFLENANLHPHDPTPGFCDSGSFDQTDNGNGWPNMDHSLWFRKVDATSPNSAPIFYNLIGNVWQYVYDGEEPPPAPLKYLGFGQPQTLAVIGLSALSVVPTPQPPPFKSILINSTGIDSTYGYSDVGFRLAYTAAGGGVSSQAVAQNLLDNVGYLPATGGN